MDKNVVIKSKVEISRNLEGYSFPHKLSPSESDIIVEKINSVLSDNKYNLVLKRPIDLSQIELNILIEKELVDEEFLLNPKTAMLLNHEKTICILINELDHIKIKVIGYNGIKEIYDIANDIDDILEAKLKYAFDKNLGYLTACPVNAGTGLKVTNLVHIPVIQKLKKIDDYYKVSHRIGVHFKGFYGKSDTILGSLYQVTNQITLGRSEENIIQSVESLSRNLSKREIESREVLKSINNVALEDDIFRSLAILSSARILTNTELMKCLSDIKLGIEMGYLNDVNLEKIDKLMTGRQPYLRVISAEDEEEKIERASYIRKEFSLANRNNK